MPLDVNVYNKLRKLYNMGYSLRQIAKLCSVSRHTVDKYCKGGILLEERAPYPEVEQQLQNLVEPMLLELLEEFKETHGKQKITSKHIWQMLKKKGIAIGESTVRKYVQELKNKKPEVFIPLDFEPGEAMEVDWGDNYAIIDDKKILISTLCCVLPFSYMPYAVPMPTKAYDSFFWGLSKTFEYFGGIPLRCIFDNLKTAVFRGTGKNAVTQEAFKYFEAHYSFESVFCNGNAGWEKGACEDLVAIIRRIAFTPIPKVKSFDELTLHVHEKCVEYHNEHKLRNRKLSVKEAFAIEKENLLPLPLKPFDCAKTFQVPVYKDATFTFDKNKYSIFPDYIGKIVSIRTEPLKIYVYYRGNLLFTHQRTYKDNDPQYIPEHYLKYMERKPRCIENALPLKIGVMPDELKSFRSLCKVKEKNMELIKVLKLGETTGKDSLLWAVDMANKSGIPTYNLVKFYIDLQSDNEQNILVDNQDLSSKTDSENDYKNEAVDFSAYDKLFNSSELLSEDEN